MSQVMEVSAKTVEDAIEKALVAWNVTREDIHIEVLEEPKKGLFGIGARDALVRVTKKDMSFSAVLETEPVEKVSDSAVVAPEREDMVQAVSEEESETVAPAAFFSAEEQAQVAQQGRDFLQSVATAMGLQVMVEKMVSPDRIVLHLHGRGLGVLIGKHGKTLNALQYLTNLAANKDVRGRYFVMLDIEDYRSRREETLVALARRMAAKVKESHRPLVLEPMGAYERKIIHMALQDDPDVYTRSEGEYQDRHLVIHYRQE